jgi:hypothetical protein
MSTITRKKFFNLNFKELWTKIRPAREKAAEVAEDTNDALDELGTILGKGFQGIMAAVGFTAIGSLMIFYISAYPGGVIVMLADLMHSLLPGVPFESAWTSLGIGFYILTSIIIVFGNMVLSMGEISTQEIILNRVDKIEEAIVTLQSDMDRHMLAPDTLTESMAMLTDKLDEIKLHL